MQRHARKERSGRRARFFFFLALAGLTVALAVSISRRPGDGPPPWGRFLSEGAESVSVPAESVEQEDTSAPAVEDPPRAPPDWRIVTVDAETGETIPGALVTLEPAVGSGAPPGKIDGRAGPDGGLVIEGLPGGEYILLVGAGGYYHDRSELVLPAEAREDHRAKLYLGSSLSGRVVDGSGRPIPRAAVFSDFSSREGWEGGEGSAGGGSNIITRTDASGEFCLRPLPRDLVYAVIAAHDEHAWGLVKEIPLRAREARGGIEIVLEEGGGIEGRVADGEGHPVEGAEVTAIPEGSSIEVTLECSPEEQFMLYGDSLARRRTVTDPRGRFTLAHLKRETYTVTVEAEGFSRASKGKLLVSDGETLPGVDFRLVREERAGTGPPELVVEGEPLIRIDPSAQEDPPEGGGVVRGTVVRGDRPAASCAVYVTSDSGKTESTETDTQGFFELRGLAPGPATLNVKYKQYSNSPGGTFEAEHSIHIDENAVTHIECVHPAPVRLFGLVTCGGERLNRGEVRARNSTGDWSSVTDTRVSGVYVLDFPGPGRYPVKFSEYGRCESEVTIDVPASADPVRRDVELP